MSRVSSRVSFDDSTRVAQKGLELLLKALLLASAKRPSWAGCGQKAQSLGLRICGLGA